MKTDFINPYRERLLVALAPARARYEALPGREQMLVAVLGLVIALVLVYLAVWEPVALMRTRQLHELQAARDAATQIELLGARAGGSRRAGAAAPAAGSVSLLTAVDQSTKDGTLSKAPARLQPDGDKQVRIWFEDVPFDALLRWMDELEPRYGVGVDNALIERRPTAGTVNARLALVRGK